jgi:hypothetical protein
MGGKLALLAATVLALLATLAPATASADDTFGVSVNRIVNDDFTPSHWDAPLSAVRAAGITVARTDATWDWAEPNPPFLHTHTFDWSRFDAIAGAFAKHGLRWMPVLAYSAHWAATNTTDVHYPPKWNEDYATYVGEFAKRYGRGGSFWAEHPELEALPVIDYEIWNEPNGAWFWKPKPNPVRYGEMYLKARAAIKAADPDGKAIIGGITNDIGFVAAMYNDNPGLAGHVDGLGWHPYGTGSADVLNNIRAARGVLLGVADPDVPIYVTELGWPTQGKHWNFLIEEPDRAKALETATDKLLRSDCGVKTVVPYTWSAPEQDPDAIEDWYGITHPDGTPTPSNTAYQRVIARWERKPVMNANRVHLCRSLYPQGPAETTDTDADGLPDAIDKDDDNDGVPDWRDLLPRDRSERFDTDLDGIGDRKDKDDDSDGLSDKLERRIHTYRTDVDTDDDGVRDGKERRMKTAPTRMDTDRDGLPDGMEQGLAKLPPDPPGAARGTARTRFRPDRDPSTRTRPKRKDTDGDRLADRREDRNGNGRRDPGETDPRAPDSDGDGVDDGQDRYPLDSSRPVDPLDLINGVEP